MENKKTPKLNSDEKKVKQEKTSSKASSKTKKSSVDHEEKIAINIKENKEEQNEIKLAEENTIENTQTEEVAQYSEQAPKKLDLISKLRLRRKKQAIAQAENAEKQINKLEEEKVEKIKFEEYVPRFYERTWFRWAIVGAVALLALIIGLIVGAVNRSNSDMPKTISLSADTLMYWDSADDITLRAYLNADYNKDKKINLRIDGGSNVAELSKTQIESGESFAIKIKVKSGYVVGGKIRVWAIANANGIATYVDILIDSPATSIEFNSVGENEIFVLDSTPFEAVAKRGDEIIGPADKSITGRNVNYDYFYKCEGGDYEIDGNKFVKVTEGTGHYKKLTDDIGTVSNRNLAANSEAKVFIEASVKKWSDYNTGEEKNVCFFAIKEIKCKRIDFQSLTVNDFYKTNTIEIEKGESRTFEYNSLLSILINSSFTNEQKLKCQNYLEIIADSANAEITNKTEDGFKIKASASISADETVKITVKYKNNNDVYLHDTFQVKLKAS